MKATPYALLIIRHFEGLSLTAYKCPAGIWTIGYGHTAHVRPGDTITQNQANELLEKDIRRFEQYLDGLALGISQNQYDALISFIFNIGTDAFSKSTMLRKIKSNPNDPSIAAEFRRWIYSQGKVLPGLQRRREEELKLYFLD